MSTTTWHSSASLKGSGCALEEDFLALCFTKAIDYWFCSDFLGVSFWIQTICCKTWAMIFWLALEAGRFHRRHRSQLFANSNFVDYDSSCLVKCRFVGGVFLLIRFGVEICLENVYDGTVSTQLTLYRELKHSLMCLERNVQTLTYCSWLVRFASTESYWTIPNLF